MKERKFTDLQKIVNVLEFENIRDVVHYINSTKATSWFVESGEHSEVKAAHKVNWYGTPDFETALNMFVNGWEEKAKQIENQFRNLKRGTAINMSHVKFTQDVVGFQPIVPNYLMGLPNSMVGTKMVMRKEKVVTLNINNSFASSVKADKIEETCLKALQLIKTIELGGCRVNLNTFYIGKVIDVIDGKRMAIYNLIKFKIKSANERLNISKVAFPLIHPSFLRRIMFKVIEHSPIFTPPFTNSYGRVVQVDEFVEVYKNMLKGEYLIPIDVTGKSKEKRFEGDYTLDKLIKF